jgi:hypothetical protein
MRPWRPEFGPEGKHFVSGNRLFLFLKNKKQRSCDGRGGGAQRPFFRVNEPRKTGARSARARTRGQNTLVVNNKERFRIFENVLKNLQKCHASLPNVASVNRRSLFSWKNKENISCTFLRFFLTLYYSIMAQKSGAVFVVAEIFDCILGLCLGFS